MSLPNKANCPIRCNRTFSVRWGYSSIYTTFSVYWSASIKHPMQSYQHLNPKRNIHRNCSKNKGENIFHTQIITQLKNQQEGVGTTCWLKSIVSDYALIKATNCACVVSALYSNLKLRAIKRNCLRFIYVIGVG